ncbi:hypothetical protein RN04_05080 [Arthrobacter sp. W1]|nr:hypothetical protein RN04_05080 [Arthrobacter sp. W1]
MLIVDLFAVLVPRQSPLMGIAQDRPAGFLVAGDGKPFTEVVVLEIFFGSGISMGFLAFFQLFEGQS